MEIKIDQESNDAKRTGVSDRAKVFSVPAGSDFLKILVQSLFNGKLIPEFNPSNNPLLLPRATIFVPNRRTARALSIAFLGVGKSTAQLLPKIQTLGDVEDEQFGLPLDILGLSALPPAVDHLSRKLELAGLIQHWVDTLSEETKRLYGEEDIIIPSSQADAIRLADDLCRLLDQITQEEVKWEDIKTLVPDEHAQWWGITTTFLQIVMEAWPEVLSERGQIDPAEQSRLLMDRRIEHYEKYGAGGPVIVAGSTGSVPSTQRLLKVISRLPSGAIVLPGLDRHISNAEWNSISSDPDRIDDTIESHPQFSIARLLASIGVDRNDVTDLIEPSPELSIRNKFISTALSLPAFTENWKFENATVDHQDLTEAFANLTVIEAANERQEATAIAIAFREILEQPDKTAALVTPNRNLARRVAIELKRFGINVDDTAGQPLLTSPAGLFLRMLVKFCFGKCDNSERIALLKSPILTAGLTTEEAGKYAKQFEILALRGAIDEPVSGNLTEFIKNRMAQTRLTGMKSGHDEEGEDEIWNALIKRVEFLDEALAAVSKLPQTVHPLKLGTFIEELNKALELLTADGSGSSSLETVVGSAEIWELFENILASDAAKYQITSREFPATLDALLAPITVRSQQQTHPRLRIYGPLEIRLLDHSRVIVAGLNEGTWPQATRNDAFLNRSMRQQLGMSSPERRIGLAAHDFQQMMGKGEVFLTRSSRVDKSPTIASRWIQRLFARLEEAIVEKICERGKRYLNYANWLDQTDLGARRQKRPNPKPPVSARPKSLPVTDIETWIRDPYALYAKRILKLRPLDPLDREADHLLRGTLFHAILEDFASLENLKLTQRERVEKLITIARGYFAHCRLPLAVEKIWQHRFDDIAERFVEWEDQHLNVVPVQTLLKEVNGGLGFAQGRFWLHARADRIEVSPEGHVSVLDYKTGMSPSVRQARSLSPQLALEAAIAVRGGFEGVPAGHVQDLAFVRLVQNENFGRHSIADTKNPISQIIEQAITNLEALIIRFEDPDKGYISRRAPFREGEIAGDYDHLARTREWSFGEDGEADE
ncbi:MAG: double-strand break repair protein AddB [Pseudomonadota bacterium]